MSDEEGARGSIKILFIAKVSHLGYPTEAEQKTGMCDSYR